MQLNRKSFGYAFLSMFVIWRFLSAEMIIIFLHCFFFKVKIRNGRFCSINNLISILLFYQETNYNF